MERTLRKAILNRDLSKFKNHKKPLADRLRLAAAFGPVHIVPPQNAQLRHALPDGTFTSDQAIKAKNAA